MLVLSRHPQERLCIGDDIILTVTGIRGDQIKIGIEAPRTVRVIREELKDNAPSNRSLIAPTEKLSTTEQKSSDVKQTVDGQAPASRKVTEPTVYYKRPRRRRVND